MIAGSIVMGPLDGREIAPGVYLVGEPTPIPGSDKMRCLANVGGALCLVELRVRFTSADQPTATPAPAEHLAHPR